MKVCYLEGPDLNLNHVTSYPDWSFYLVSPGEIEPWLPPFKYILTQHLWPSSHLIQFCVFSAVGTELLSSSNHSVIQMLLQIWYLGDAQFKSQLDYWLFWGECHEIDHDSLSFQILICHSCSSYHLNRCSNILTAETVSLNYLRISYGNGYSLSFWILIYSIFMTIFCLFDAM